MELSLSVSSWLLLNEKLFPALEWAMVLVVGCLAFRFVPPFVTRPVSWSLYSCRRRSTFIRYDCYKSVNSAGDAIAPCYIPESYESERCARTSFYLS